MKLAMSLFLIGAMSVPFTSVQATETENKNKTHQHTKKYHHGKKIHKKLHHKKYHHQHQKIYKTEVAQKTASPVAESNGFSGTFTLASNYVFRGLSQNGNKPTVQGGLTYEFASGIYGNVWGSNVDFEAPNGATATVELDTILGIRNDIWEGLTYDINIARYHYPGAHHSNYNEFNGLLNYKIIQLGLSYTGNYAGTHGHGTYYSALLTYDIPEAWFTRITNLSFQAGMGYYDLAAVAGNNYKNYLIAINKKLNDTYTLSLQWTGTDGKANLPPNDNNQIIGTVTASF